MRFDDVFVPESTSEPPMKRRQKQQPRPPDGTENSGVYTQESEEIAGTITENPLKSPESFKTGGIRFDDEAHTYVTAPVNGENNTKPGKKHSNGGESAGRTTDELNNPAGHARSETTETTEIHDTDSTDTHADGELSGTINTETQSPDQKLKFTKEEKKINSLERKSGKYGKKLDKARSRLPTKKVKKKQRVFNEEKGKKETKLSFEEETIPIGDAKWNNAKPKTVKGKVVNAGKSTVRTAQTAAVNKLHSKVSQVEGENVGTQAAHRAELLGESAYRGSKRLIHETYRHHKNRPYRTVSKLETKSVKNDIKLSYQKALRDNPKLKSNAFSRFFQKRSIKRQYANALKNAKNGAKTVKQSAGVMAKVSNVVTGLIRRNPILWLKVALLLLIIFVILSLFTMCQSLLSGGSAFIGAVSYAADDADIDNAELNYTEWETDLQMTALNAESTHSGYDEYRYRVGDIGHDPFELMAFLTAVYGDFTYAAIEPVLRDIFNEQYTLEFIPETEIRTRTETRQDWYYDEYLDEIVWYEYEVEIEYEWYILNVTLTAKPFSQVIYPRMTTEQQQHFEILMQTKGARKYTDNPFDVNWLPYVTSYYGYRIHPITGVKDYHKGIDIGLPAGTEIKAGFDGTVVAVGYDAGGYGNYVVVENEKGVQAKYAHCQSISVSMGQTVDKGDLIAIVGNTGNSTGAHLHLEVVKDGLHINPLYFAETGDDGSGHIPPGSPGGIVIPPYSGEPMGDGSFAALLAEAEKYVGYPYVWGGSSPSTSFDCSGYICWILNQSGVTSVGRTTAQGLFNLTTPVSLTDAQPGDLLFFHSTYSSSNPVTHVALYLGGNVFIHAGDPIGYGNLSSSYWQNHFYSVGRIN